MTKFQIHNLLLAKYYTFLFQIFITQKQQTFIQMHLLQVYLSFNFVFFIFAQNDYMIKYINTFVKNVFPSIMNNK